MLLGVCTQDPVTPWWDKGVGHHLKQLGLQGLVDCWAGLPGKGLMETAVDGSHAPGSLWPVLVVVCWGRMAGRLLLRMWTRIRMQLSCVAASVVAVRAGSMGAQDAVRVGIFWRGRFCCCCAGLCPGFER